MGKKLALGAVVGAVAGVVVGVLMAPKSGKETRGDIKKRAVQLKKNAEKAKK
jgi:gas vesicle protein